MGQIEKFNNLTKPVKRRWLKRLKRSKGLNRVTNSILYILSKLHIISYFNYKDFHVEDATLPKHVTKRFGNDYVVLPLIKFRVDCKLNLINDTEYSWYTFKTPFMKQPKRIKTLVDHDKKYYEMNLFISDLQIALEGKHIYTKVHDMNNLVIKLPRAQEVYNNHVEMTEIRPMEYDNYKIDYKHIYKMTMRKILTEVEYQKWLYYMYQEGVKQFQKEFENFTINSVLVKGEK